MTKLTLPLVTAVLTAFAGQFSAKTLPPPKDVTVRTEGFPEIRLANVNFVYDCGGYGVCVGFTASMVFDGSVPWHDLTLRVDTYTSDGKTFSYEVAGETDDSGVVTKFIRKFIPPFEYKLADISKIQIVAMSGTTLEFESRESFAGFMAKDPGCMKDLLKAKRQEGLAERKALAELLQYGCIKAIEGPAWIGFRKDAPEIGPGVVMVALLAADDENSGEGYVAASDIKHSPFPLLHKYPAPVKQVK